MVNLPQFADGQTEAQGAQLTPKGPPASWKVDSITAGTQTVRSAT